MTATNIFLKQNKTKKPTSNLWKKNVFVFAIQFNFFSTKKTTTTTTKQMKNL